jgi:AcrR family transcriptional regulator
MSSVPRATRRSDVRSDIVAAAARILSEQGAQAVTTRAVALAAGVQAPSIYRLFGDKDGLIDAVAEHVLTTYAADKAAVAQHPGDDPVADLRGAWCAHVHFGLANAELYALINTPGRAPRSPAITAGIDVLRTRLRRIASAGLLRVDEQRALEMIHAAGTGTVLALLHNPPHLRDLGLAEAMFSAVTASILTTSLPMADTTANTLAITFLTIISDLPALTDAERTIMTEWILRSLTHLRPGDTPPPVAASE